MKYSYIFKSLFISGLLLLFMSCGKKQSSDESDKNQLKFTGDTVFVSEHSSVLSRLRIEQINLQEYISSCTTSGTVKPLSGHLAEVSSPFEGRIVRSQVKLGQRVEIGTPLFEITSSEYLDAVKSFMQARQGLQLSRTNFKRKKDLTEHGIGSQKELDEARSDYQNNISEFEKARATLKVFNVSTKNLNIFRPLIVRSPIAGEVVKNDIVVGQYLKSDNNAIVTVANLGKVWVVAKVKENHIGEIGRNDNVEVSTECNPERPISGTVDYIGNIMDEETRSVEVYVICNNHYHVLKPGMFVTANFKHRHEKILTIPSTALMQQGDKSYVFVKIGKNKFIKRPVTVISDGKARQVVKSGLEDGENIVTKGGIYLR